MKDQRIHRILQKCLPDPKLQGQVLSGSATDILIRHVEAAVEILREPTTYDRLMSELGLPDTPVNGLAISTLLLNTCRVSKSGDGPETWKLGPEW